MRKQKKEWKQVMLALTLTILWTSCQSSKVVYVPVEPELPEVPKPYDVNGELVLIFNEESESVTMPLWYWKKIVRFFVDVKGYNKDVKSE